MNNLAASSSTSASRVTRRKVATPQPNRDFARIVKAYVADVTSGKIPANRFVRKAAQRHLRDLERSKDKAYPYKYDVQSGARVCRFIETLPHIKGRWARAKELIVLQPWQVFLVMVLFGWLKKSNGMRRFRKAYWCIPRKNGKSILAAAIGLYMMLHDHEFGAEVYSGATTEKQAWEVFGPAKLMAERTPELLAHFGAECWAKILLRPRDGSKFEPLIGDPGDGASPSCAIVDEFHEHDTPALHDTMETGMGSREQPLMLIITTAGYNIAGPCYDMHDLAIKILEGTSDEDDIFCVMFGVDKEDDWADPKSLVKANPNFNVSVDGEFLLAQQRSAMSNPIQQNKFKTKHLNVWCSVLSAWMNMQLWQQCADEMLDEDELIEARADCFISFDLASKSDLCTEQKLFRRILNGKPHYYLFGRYWLPENTIEEAGPNHAHYDKWVKKGLLTPTEGSTIDFEEVVATIVADCKKINPVEVVFDPFIATQTAQAIQESGAVRKDHVVEFVQQPQYFAVPMDDMFTAIKDGRFHHDGNEITTWCVANVVARRAKKGLSAPMKSKPHLKIDGAVAAIMGFGRAIATKEKEKAYQMLTL